MGTKFGEAVRRARRANNLKQDELAELIGMQRSYLSKIESGRVTNPESATRERIASAMGLTPNELLEFVGSSVLEETAWYVPDMESDELMQVFQRLTDDNRERLLVIAYALYRHEQLQ